MKSVKPKSKIKNPVIAKYVDAKEKQILEIQSMFSNMVDEIVKIKSAISNIKIEISEIKSQILNLQNQKSKTKSSKPNIENEIPKINYVRCRMCSYTFIEDNRKLRLCDACTQKVIAK